MMTMRGVVAIAAILLFMASSASAWGIGLSFCTCYVNGRVIFGTTIRSPDGSFSYCSCNGNTQQPPDQNPTTTPPSNDNAPHPPQNPTSPPGKTPPTKNNPPAPPHTTPSKNPPPAPPTPIQLPPLPFLNPAAQACLQEFVNVNVCLPQVTQSYYHQNFEYVQPYCCQQLQCLSQNCASTIFNSLNLPYYRSVLTEYCCNRV